MPKEEKDLRKKIENGRAAFAFKRAKNFVQSHDEKSNKEYRSYIKRLPAMIQTNGLGQSMAFCYANKNNVYGSIYEDIAAWIKEQQPQLLKKYTHQDNEEFVEIIINMNSGDYRIISNEVMAYLNWMRRFVDGMIKGM